MSQRQPIARKPVLFQTVTGLYLGMVCFNPLYETLKFVLEKREFFEVEWPALVNFAQNGLFPMLLGLPYFTIQRTQIVWYSIEIPEALLNHYQTLLPHLFTDGVLQKEESSLSDLELFKSESSSKSAVKKTKESKIIPFPVKKDEPEAK